MRPRRPEEAYESLVTDLWPQVGDEDPHQFELDKAYQRVVTTRRLNLVTGEWEATHGAARLLLRITCEPLLHRAGAAPILAEVWTTRPGLLYVSLLRGAVFDAANDSLEPFAPPSPLSPRANRTTVPSSSLSGQWLPLPVTIERVLLGGPVDADLWVKCPEHGGNRVDPVRLYKQYEDDRAARRRHDTRKPRVVRLHDVLALS